MPDLRLKQLLNIALGLVDRRDGHSEASGRFRDGESFVGGQSEGFPRVVLHARANPHDGLIQELLFVCTFQPNRQIVSRRQRLQGIIPDIVTSAGNLTSDVVVLIALLGCLISESKMFVCFLRLVCEETVSSPVGQGT